MNRLAAIGPRLVQPLRIRRQIRDLAVAIDHNTDAHTALTAAVRNANTSTEGQSALEAKPDSAATAASSTPTPPGHPATPQPATS